MTHYKKECGGDTLVLSVGVDGYSIASVGEPEPNGYTGQPASYSGWKEISAVEASALLGWDVTA